MKKYGGELIAQGTSISVDVGVIPDKVIATAKAEETNPLIYTWYKERANTANSNAQYGYLLTGSTGVITKCADGDNGIQEYDTVELKYLGQSPDGNGEASASIYGTYAYGIAQTKTPTARSTSVFGTIIRPTVANGLIYECTTTSGAMAVEPTWGTVLGGTTTDSNSNVWTARNEKLKNVGAKGFVIGTTISTNTDEWTWEAEVWDSVAPERDAASYDPVGKYPNN